MRMWVRIVMCSLLMGTVLALPHSKEYGKLSGGRGTGAEYVPQAGGREPSCEELRAMWRFSKRQSRATDITNEIPTYRDPFAYNMWIPYARSRSIVGGIGQRRKGVIYGKPVFEAPRSRNREEMARLFNTAVPQGPVPTRKVQTAFRLSGGGVPLGQLPQAGSFQHLQKLIRAERARELQQQRMAEEEAARQSALKEVGSPTYFGRMVQDPHHPSLADYIYPAASRNEDFLSPRFAEHLHNHRSLPESLTRSGDLDQGYYHH